MNTAVTIVRVLLGLLFLFASTAYLFNLVEPPAEMPARVRAFNEGIAAAGYLMPLVKWLELAGALALLANRYVALALVVLAPIVVNIFLFHAVVDRSGAPVGVFVLAATLFLAYAHRASYAPLFEARAR